MLKQALVFTDMDGTLLDHHDYSFTPALNMLDTLRAKGIPVIPTTSKTKDELISLMAELKLNGPFIVENGAGIYLPKHTFTQHPANCVSQDGFWLKSFSPPRDHWLTIIALLARDFEGEFLAFSQMTKKQIVEYTGLDEKRAQLANSRLYSEPIKWLGSDERKNEFIGQLQHHGAHVLQGGRFLGVSGACNKGLALNWVVEAYHALLGHKGTLSIALGDSDNDIAMLETSDIAVRIKSPIHGFPSLNHPKQIVDSTLMGPSGWSECLSKILTNVR